MSNAIKRRIPGFFDRIGCILILPVLVLTLTASFTAYPVKVAILNWLKSGFFKKTKRQQESIHTMYPTHQKLFTRKRLENLWKTSLNPCCKPKQQETVEDYISSVAESN
jgi:hypothetical protein